MLMVVGELPETYGVMAVITLVTHYTHTIVTQNRLHKNAKHAQTTVLVHDLVTQLAKSTWLLLKRLT